MLGFIYQYQYCHLNIKQYHTIISQRIATSMPTQPSSPPTTTIINTNLPPSDISGLPQPYKQLWVTNIRLQKQLDILNMELQQKQRTIRQLKLEIDSTILEDTKNRLEVVRLVQDEVQTKTKQAKKEYLDKLANLQADIDKRNAEYFRMEQDIAKQRQKNTALVQKMEQLKEHVIVAIEEKDLIIRELAKIINQKQMEAKVQHIRRQAVSNHEHRQDYTQKLKQRVIQEEYGNEPVDQKTLRSGQPPYPKNPPSSKTHKNKVQITRNL